MGGKQEIFGKKINDNEMPYNWLYLIIDRQYFTVLVVGKIVVLLTICGLSNFVKYGCFCG